MVQIAGFKSKLHRLLHLCVLLFLTADVRSEPFESPANVSISVVVVEAQQEHILNPLGEKKHKHFSSTSQQQPNVAETFVIPVLHVIAELGRLMGTSMQQLDTAFSWPDALPKMEDINMKNVSFTFTPSPLIDYPQSFRTTLQQINQKLSKTLRTINSKADRIAMQVVSAPSSIRTLERYLDSSQKSSNLDSLISMHLNRLGELSGNNDLLTKEASFELETMVNLTKAFFDVVKDMHSTKLNYTNNTLYPVIVAKIIEENKLQKEIDSLNEVYKKKSNEVEQWVEKKNSGIFAFAEGRKSMHRNDKESLNNLKKQLKLSENQKEWNSALKKLNKTEAVLREKREYHHNMSMAIKVLEHKKTHLDRDINLLVNSMDLVNQIVIEMEKIVFGWNKLANFSSDILTQLSTVSSKLLSPNNSISGTSKLLSINEMELQEVKRGLKMIREDMDSVGKMAKAYVNAYNSDLSSLMSKLDQMATISHVNPDVLNQELIAACLLVENKLMGKSPESTERSTERSDIVIGENEQESTSQFVSGGKKVKGRQKNIAKQRNH